MAAFTFNDAFMKALSGELPLFQAVFLRGLCVTLFLTILCAALGQLRLGFSRMDWWLIALRGLCEIAVAYLFITALFNMPIANVSAILQALPLTVSLAAALFFGEALGWRRLTAILIGFVGVVMIVQPGGEGFNIYALWVLAAVIGVTVRDLAARRMSRAVPSVMAALIAAVMVTVAAGVASAFIAWSPVTGASGIKVLAAAFFIIGGYVFSVSAMRIGDVSAVAPFRYTSLLVALVIGVVVFGELPNTIALVGAAIVVATGLFTLYREGRARRKIRAAEVFK
ncbi:DMT family transporter [Cognatiyoonia koreensis]|nr:DMT family transporter [Cognatiyoonia koreensis]